jgi:hypothetical protein
LRQIDQKLRLSDLQVGSLRTGFGTARTLLGRLGKLIVDIPMRPTAFREAVAPNKSSIPLTTPGEQYALSIDESLHKWQSVSKS